MVYAYGTTAVHGYPTPLDNTPLDATSWAKLVDTIGIGVPMVCASATEQSEYLAAVTAAGLGPSVRSIVRVCRTDLDGLIMRNKGTGWVRDSSGSFSQYGQTTSSATDTSGSSRQIGAIPVDLPCAAHLAVSADVLVRPPALPASWGIRVWLQDGTGRLLTEKRRYGHNVDQLFYATITAPVSMPAGVGRVEMWGSVDVNSGPINWSNISLSAHYA